MCVTSLKAQNAAWVHVDAPHLKVVCLFMLALETFCSFMWPKETLR